MNSPFNIDNLQSLKAISKELFEKSIEEETPSLKIRKEIKRLFNRNWNYSKKTFTKKGSIAYSFDKMQQEAARFVRDHKRTIKEKTYYKKNEIINAAEKYFTAESKTIANTGTVYLFSKEYGKIRISTHANHTTYIPKGISVNNHYDNYPKYELIIENFEIKRDIDLKEYFNKNIVKNH